MESPAPGEKQPQAPEQIRDRAAGKQLGMKEKRAAGSGGGEPYRGMLIMSPQCALAANMP